VGASTIMIVLMPMVMQQQPEKGQLVSHLAQHWQRWLLLG
jgi:hypothetical protein